MLYIKGGIKMNSSVAQKTEKKTFLQKFIDFVEIGGNKLPHPLT